MKAEGTFKRVSAVVAAVFLAATLMGAALAGCGDETTTTPTTARDATTKTKADSGKGMSFEAEMTGQENVPPVTTAGSGEAEFKLSEDGSSMTFKVEVKDVADIAQSHIHLAAAGANGPIVVTLFKGSKAGSFSGTLAEGTITAADLEGPLQGKTLNDLITEIKAGNAYANVHTSANPAGIIRGQVEAE